MATLRDTLEGLLDRRLPDSAWPPTVYGMTAAESAASVTPVNLGIAPGSVDRYASNTIPGTTSMVAAFNAAIAQCQQVGGSQVTYGLTNLYLLDAPVNCTFTGSANQPGIVIRNVAGGGQDQGAGLIATHTGSAVFDCTGCDSFTAYDVVIHTPLGLASNACPQTGFLWARNAAGGSQFNRLINCKVIGSFGVAPFYNYGSEDSVLVGCYFANYCSSPGTKTRVYTSSNISGITSAFTTIFAGSISTTDHTAIGCQDLNTAGTTTSDNVYLEGVDGFHNYSGWGYCASTAVFTGTANQTGGSNTMTVTAAGAVPLTVGMQILGSGVSANKLVTGFGTGTGGTGTYTVSDTAGFSSTAITGGKNGRALFYIDQSAATSNEVEIRGLKGETTTAYLQQYGVFFSNDSATPTGWTIESSFLPNFVLAISSGASTTLDNFFVRAIGENASHGFHANGTIQNSILETVDMVLNFTTSKNNVLIGDSSRWTITTRTDDNWIDQGSVNKTWTPALGTVSHGGVLTINEAHCLITGNQVDVEFLMTDTVSITAALGQTITGLPKTASARSAMVMVANATTAAAIGAGFIDAGTTSIKMPAFTVGAGVTVCVSARYFIA